MAEDTGSTSLRQREAGLPRWGWITLAAAGGVLGLVWYQSHRAAQATAGQQTVDTTAQGLDTGQYESLLAILRDLQGQPSQPTPTPTPTSPWNPTITIPTPNNPTPVQNWIDTSGPGPMRNLTLIAGFRGKPSGAQDILNANTDVLSGISNPLHASLPNGLKLRIPWLDVNGNHLY